MEVVEVNYAAVVGNCIQDVTVSVPTLNSRLRDRRSEKAGYLSIVVSNVR